MNKKKEELFKILLMGLDEKAEMIKPYVKPVVDEFHKKSIGANFTTTIIETDNYLSKLQIWDLSSDPVHQTIIKSFVIGTSAAIIVGDTPKLINDCIELVQSSTPHRVEIVVMSPKDSMKVVLRSLTERLLKARYAK